MGWTGCFIDCPKTKEERIREALRQEGYHAEDIVDMALVGTVLYMAVRLQNGIVYGTVLLTNYDRYRQEFYTKVIGEDMGPCEIDCPKRILDKLSPTDNEYAITWRDRCDAKRKSNTERKKNDKLGNLPYGSQIRLLGSNGGRDFTGTILYVEKRHGRKAFIDYSRMSRFSKPLVEAVGWELVE